MPIDICGLARSPISGVGIGHPVRVSIAPTQAASNACTFANRRSLKRSSDEPRGGPQVISRQPVGNAPGSDFRVCLRDRMTLKPGGLTGEMLKRDLDPSHP
jgi:hypothetical protein